MSPRLAAFLDAIIQRQPLEPLLEAIQAPADLSLAQEVEAFFEEALRQHHIDAATVGASLASLIYLQLGLRQQSLRLQIHALQGEFMATKDEDAYGVVREHLLHAAKAAKELNEQQLLIRCFLTAADCAYFGYQASAKDNPAKKRWLPALANDLVQTVELGPIGIAPADMHKMLSLVPVAVDLLSADRFYLGGFDESGDLLRRLAHGVDRVVSLSAPAEIHPDRATAIERRLAEFGLQFGDASIAGARLDLLLAKAEEEGDIEAWIYAATLRYAAAKKTAEARTSTARLAAEIRERADRFRARFRSRTGRLCAAQELDEGFSDIVRDELASPQDDETPVRLVDGLKARMLLDAIVCGSTPIDGPAAAMAAALEKRLLSFEPDQTNDVVHREMRLVSRLPIGLLHPGHSLRFPLISDADRRASLAEIEGFHARYHSGFEQVAPVAQLMDIQAQLLSDEAARH